MPAPTLNIHRAGLLKELEREPDVPDIIKAAVEDGHFDEALTSGREISVEFTLDPLTGKTEWRGAQIDTYEEIPEI